MPIALYMEYVPGKHRGVMLVALQSFWTLGTIIEVGGLALMQGNPFCYSARGLHWIPLSLRERSLVVKQQAGQSAFVKSLHDAKY